MLRLFLDSNIFLGYAIPFEDWHDECHKLFYGEFDRYSGKRVKEEIDDVIKRRMQGLYDDLTRHFAQGKRQGQFYPSRELSESDYRHLQDWLRTVTTRDPSQILTKLRHMIAEIKIGIENAFQRVSPILVDYSNDNKLQAKLEACIGNSNDAWILVDAFCWCEKQFKVTFCTTDAGHIFGKRDETHKIISIHRGIRAVNIPLRISHIKEIIV